MKRLRSQLVLAGLMLAACCSSAAGQNYSFSVPKLRMVAIVQPDASVRIVYDITFRNNGGAHPIDIVDIGVPHDDYDLGNVRA